MAKYLIFSNEGNLKKIAASDEEKDNIIFYSEVAVSCSDSEFDNVQKGRKTATYDNNSVSYTDKNSEIQVELDAVELARPENERASAIDVNGAIEFIKTNLNNYIEFVQNLLVKNNDTEATAYLNALKNIDQNSISLPSSNMTFEEWLLSQPGFPQKTILQLKI